MKQIISKYAIVYHLAFAACVTGGMASCTDDTENNLLTAGKEEPLTRAVYLNVPLDTESLDASKVRIFMYDQTGTKLLGEVEDTSIEQYQDRSYLAHGIIQADNAAIEDNRLKCRLVLLGNTASDGNIASIQQQTFDYSVTSLPFFGALSVDELLDAKMEVSCAEIPMLRSGALLKVELSQVLRDAGITLGAVVLKNVNKTGYVAPKNAATFNSLTDIEASKFFNPYNGSQKIDLELAQMPDSSMQSFVPECQALSETPFEITLQFLRDGKPYTGNFGDKIYLKDYVTNKPLDILRGNQYIFTIRSLQTDVDLDIKVEEWKEVTPENVVFK